jgi:hypothetical protein
MKVRPHILHAIAVDMKLTCNQLPFRSAQARLLTGRQQVDVAVACADHLTHLSAIIRLPISATFD